MCAPATDGDHEGLMMIDRPPPLVLAAYPTYQSALLALLEKAPPPPVCLKNSHTAFPQYKFYARDSSSHTNILVWEIFQVTRGGGAFSSKASTSYASSRTFKSVGTLVAQMGWGKWPCEPHTHTHACWLQLAPHIRHEWPSEASKRGSSRGIGITRTDSSGGYGSGAAVTAVRFRGMLPLINWHGVLFRSSWWELRARRRFEKNWIGWDGMG
ncbi:hypothetical protein DFH27DRAFT_116584 [Peziza echinospora]|nr:hypothetical protein DFH27DRAFT_116584 [Peziza echinospora]